MKLVRSGKGDRKGKSSCSSNGGHGRNRVGWRTGRKPARVREEREGNRIKGKKKTQEFFLRERERERDWLVDKRSVLRAISAALQIGATWNVVGPFFGSAVAP